MLNWTVAGGPGAAADHGATIAAVIEHLGKPAFATRLLDLSHAVVDAGSMCAYRLSRDAGPALYCSASREATDRTGSCWRIYRDDLYRADETFATAFVETAGGALAVGHLTATDVRYAPHRKRIYQDHALLDRLTVAAREADGALLAVNFYRHRHQGHFSDAQLAAFETIASPVLAAVRRDHELRVASTALGDLADGSKPERIASFETRLAVHEPRLTPRERAVCARLLIGMLYEGIAHDLDISLASVKTYRKRAFERLDIHFRSELYGIAIGLARP